MILTLGHRLAVYEVTLLEPARRLLIQVIFSLSQGALFDSFVARERKTSDKERGKGQISSFPILNFTRIDTTLVNGVRVAAQAP